MKDIFKVEMPKEIFIQEGKVLDTPPEKVHREKAFAPSILESLDYDNSTPLDTEGRPIQFDDRTVLHKPPYSQDIFKHDTGRNE